MKKHIGVRGKIFQLLALAILFSVSPQSNAHVMGISWTDIGENTIRFYAETAHSDPEGPAGGSLRIGLQDGLREDRTTHEWTGVVLDTTFDELGIDNMTYWDPDDPTSLLDEWNYDSHSGSPGSYGDFYYVDVQNFTSGDYVFSLIGSHDNAYDRRLADVYLTGTVNVPEPPIMALFGVGLLAVFMLRFYRRDNAEAPVQLAA